MIYSEKITPRFTGAGLCDIHKFMQSTYESWKCLSASRVSRMERASRCYWKKISREIPARSLVSSDTFDSVRWFRKYDATSRPGPFGAPPSLKSSPQAGIHISRLYMPPLHDIPTKRKKGKKEEREIIDQTYVQYGNDLYTCKIIAPKFIFFE